ncbi:hypothetical protein Ddc_07383 [Ditylenchus destructor]|nr:hypothetical protein Ddc_07383 [Ditylenchus destructor]
MRLIPAGFFLLLVGIVDGKYWKPSTWDWTPQNWHKRLKIHHAIVSAQSESESSEGDFPSIFKNSELAFKEPLTESGAEQLHNYESQADPESVPEDNEFHDVVWKDFRCAIHNFNIYLFVSCYMEYFGLKHYEIFDERHKALHSKKFKAIKLGAISALIRHYTGCDLDLTNYDDLEERERYAGMGRTISSEGSSIEECRSVYHRHTIQLDIDQDSTNQDLKIKFSDNLGNKIHVERKDANSWRLAIGVAHKGIMVATRIDKHTLEFGLKCSICGDSIEIIENCEQRKVRYSTGVTFHVPFVLVDSCVKQVESSASEDSKYVTPESISIEETDEERPKTIRKSKLNSKRKFTPKRKQMLDSMTKPRIKPKKRAKHKLMHDTVLKLKSINKRQRKPKPKHELDPESESSSNTELELESEAKSEMKHGAESKSELEHDPELVPEQEAEHGGEAEPESESELELDPELEPEQETEHGGEAEPESESELELDPELEPEQETEHGRESEPESKSDGEFVAESIPEPDPKPEKLIDTPSTLKNTGRVLTFGEQLFQRGPQG